VSRSVPSTTAVSYVAPNCCYIAVTAWKGQEVIGSSLANWEVYMGLQFDGRSPLDDSRNARATLGTSRRSFIAGWKQCAGAALGLCLAARSSSAQTASPTSSPTTSPIKKSCFLPGTRIKTPEGEVNIEELQIGDNVLTALGETRPVKFIGRRKISRERTGPWNGDGPVKISRFAIDGKAPHSDLYISPGHAIYIDGILIPAINLVNGVTIVADAKPEALSLTYFHIELDTHEAILAEGLAVESFRLVDQLTHAFWFDNADEYVRLYGSPGEPPAPFAPILRYRRSRHELASHMRSALAPVYDFRKPIEKVRDRIIDRFARAA
jgi:Hint domain